MARIIGGIACSHTPTIGFAVDREKQNDPVWAPIFKDFAPVTSWLHEKKPDVLFMIYNDHITSFFFDHYSAFTLGIGESYNVADEGGGVRELPPIKGHAALSQHIGASLMADEFDMSFFQDRGLDHGCLSPLSIMRDGKEDWSVPIIPLAVGVLQFPIPSGKRCYALGKALRRAIESYPEDISVAIIGTGGLSHQVHGARCGFNNTEWDLQFLDMLEKDPESLTRMTVADLAELGGFEGAEIIMWLIMRGALSASVKKIHQSYYLPSMTGIATVVYENQDCPVPKRDVNQEHRDHINYQLAGAEKLAGTHPFTHALSVKAYRINKFLHALVRPEHRKLFLEDLETAFEQSKLTEQERDLLRRRDWDGLIRYGVSFFLLEKLGAVIGVSNLHIYSAMKGMSLDDFLATRNAPGAVYSVAAKTDKQESWDKANTK